ncbi:Protein of unknown function [Cotesia congregata]|uniref:Uncharacterized protein n=1 Tax=Cotesia congregata TaxID=51543 RepID=A0A8J2HP91_COTCN|nr:Protein of unknown function [Cotesia congregata]
MQQGSTSNGSLNVSKIPEHKINSEHYENRTCLLLYYFDELGRILVIKSRLQLDKKLKNSLSFLVKILKPIHTNEQSKDPIELDLIAERHFFIAFKDEGKFCSKT